MTRIEIETHIDAPLADCFDLALDLAVHEQSAAFSGEKLVAPGKVTGRLEEGDLFCFEGRHLGLRQRFCARIVEVRPPHRFVDEMVQGIFKWLRHVHEFEFRDGATLMRDTLEWETPFGPLGRVADALFLRRHMRWFVATKQDRLRSIAEERLRDRATIATRPV